MNRHLEPDDGAPDLLHAERELSPEEQSRVRRIGEAGWRGLQALLSGRAHTTYSAASQEDFTECALNHMNDVQRADMVGAEIYFCPTCSRLLKDRGSTAASSVLLERKRVRELWLDVEQSPPEDFTAALDRFRRALGLPQ